MLSVLCEKMKSSSLQKNWFLRKTLISVISSYTTPCVRKQKLQLLFLQNVAGYTPICIKNKLFLSIGRGEWNLIIEEKHVLKSSPNMLFNYYLIAIHQRNIHFKSSRKKPSINFMILSFFLANTSESLSKLFLETDCGIEEDEKKEKPFAIELVSVNGTISLTFSVYEISSFISSLTINIWIKFNKK